MWCRRLVQLGYRAGISLVPSTSGIIESSPTAKASGMLATPPHAHQRGVTFSTHECGQ